MRIESIKVRNFKSLVDFQLDLAKFTCLVGLNGSGKSTALQLIDFVAQQVRGDIKGWLAQRQWKPGDLRSKLSHRRTIQFMVRIVADEAGAHESLTWVATFNTSTLRCSVEVIRTPAAFLEVRDGKVRIVERGPDVGDGRVVLDQQISFDYEGSILSRLLPSVLGSDPSLGAYSLLGFKNYFSEIHSLELLSPHLLRQKTRSAEGTLGPGGQRLSAFLHEMGHAGRDALCKDLRQVYPQLAAIEASSLRSGWKQLKIFESFSGNTFSSEARQVNDGMLRLMAILAELSGGHRFLLFDEIENGVNPELVEFLVDRLVETPKQVAVTTHSPMILNYLDDEAAKSGVIYLYKTAQGQTRSIPFFSIPSIARKLTVMGPGEAFVDTDLIRLIDEIESLAEAR